MGLVDLSLLYHASVVILVMGHVMASLQDIRTREISDWVWLLSGSLAAPMAAYWSLITGRFVLYLVGALVGVSVALAIYFLRLMGGADAKSIAVISLSLPTIPLENLPLTIINLTPVSVLINSLVFSLVVYLPYNVAVNLANMGRCQPLAKLRGVKKMLYSLALMCVPAYKVLKNPSNYSIAQVPSGDGFRPVLGLRLGFEDPRDHLVDWLAKGLIEVDSYVLTTYHIPYIVSITVGLVAYVATGYNFLTFILSL